MAGNGALAAPQGVAVDGDSGNVYVSDRDNRRINAYDASGNFLFSVGRDVARPRRRRRGLRSAERRSTPAAKATPAREPGEIGSTSAPSAPSASPSPRPTATPPPARSSSPTPPTAA